MIRPRNWSIRRRLVVASVGVLVPYLALTGLSLAGLRLAFQQAFEIHHELAEELGAAWQLHEVVDELEQSVAAAATGGSTEWVVVAPQVTRLRDLLTTAAALYHDPKEQQAVETLTQQARRLEALAAELARIPGRGPSPDAAAKAEAMSQAVQEGHAAITRIQRVALRESLEQRERIRMVTRRTILGILGAAALSLAVGVILAVVFSRWIGAPLRSIAEASRRLAEGDLAHRVEVSAGAELGEMARAFNLMAERIQALEADLRERVRELETALAEVKTLGGLLPMCAWCRKIRADDNYWHELESYVVRHAGMEFSHSICPDCRASFRAGRGDQTRA